MNAEQLKEVSELAAELEKTERFNSYFKYLSKEEKENFSVRLESSEFESAFLKLKLWYVIPAVVNYQEDLKSRLKELGYEP